MEENTITLTETELQTRIDDAVKLATDKLTSKHNGEMATVRKSYEDKIKQASMSAEEIAQEKARELAQARDEELNDLRAFKKSTIIKDKIASAGLPSHFVYDSRLLSAEEGELDKTIKTVKAEYEASLPKGNTHSSVVQVGGSGNNAAPKDDKDKVHQEVSNVISNLLK